MNYDQYNSRPANHRQGTCNRQRNRSNNNGNCKRYDQSPHGNRDNNSNQNQGNGQYRDNTHWHPNRQTIVCTYPHCGLKGHKEDDGVKLTISKMQPLRMLLLNQYKMW